MGSSLKGWPSMRTVTVTKYNSDQSTTVEIEGDECPACAALVKYGCPAGIIFLACEGELYRCKVFSLGPVRFTYCKKVSQEEAERELMQCQDQADIST